MCLGGVVFWALDLDDGDEYGSSVLDEVYSAEEVESNIRELISILKRKMNFSTFDGSVSDYFFDKLANAIKEVGESHYLSDLEQKQVFSFSKVAFYFWNVRKDAFSWNMVSEQTKKSKASGKRP